MKTLYDLIGARRNDDAESLKKAYRNAVKATHPDHHADDPEAARRLMQITAAYDVLGDAGQRLAYDQSLENRPEPPTALLMIAAPPAPRRAFVSRRSLGATVALTFTGASLLVAGVSGVSIGDVVRQGAPRAGAAAAVQPAAPDMPIIVAGPGPATPSGDDPSASEQARDGTPSQATIDGASSRQAQNTDAPQATRDGPQSEETVAAGEAIAGARPDVDMDRTNPAIPPAPPPANKEADTVIASEQQFPALGCRRWQITAILADGYTIQKCVDTIIHAPGGRSRKTASRSGDSRVRLPAPTVSPVEPRPGAFNLGPLCLSTDPTACPMGGDERRR